MEVGILGGSFDPIHHGHLIVGTVVAESLGLDEVRFVPAREQPFKVGMHGAPAADRLAMTELAVQGRRGFAVDPLECERDGPSYSVTTVQVMASREPSCRFHLLLGTDAAALFGQWREPDAIRARARVVVFGRTGEPIPTDLADAVVTVPRVDISSTDIRERVRDGRSIRYWVPEVVDQYIAAHGLYRETHRC